MKYIEILYAYIYIYMWADWSSRPLVLMSHHCTWILLFNERLGRSSWRNRARMNGEGQSTKPPWLWFLCYPRDAINLSKDDWGVQSPHQESIWVPLPFSEDEPGSLKFSFFRCFQRCSQIGSSVKDPGWNMFQNKGTTISISGSCWKILAFIIARMHRHSDQTALQGLVNSEAQWSRLVCEKRLKLSSTTSYYILDLLLRQDVNSSY